jgi:hypothetical protein
MEWSSEVVITSHNYQFARYYLVVIPVMTKFSLNAELTGWSVVGLNNAKIIYYVLRTLFCVNDIKNVVCFTIS